LYLTGKGPNYFLGQLFTVALGQKTPLLPPQLSNTPFSQLLSSWKDLRSTTATPSLPERGSLARKRLFSSASPL